MTDVVPGAGLVRTTGLLPVRVRLPAIARIPLALAYFAFLVVESSVRLPASEDPPPRIVSVTVGATTTDPPSAPSKLNRPWRTVTMPV